MKALPIAALAGTVLFVSSLASAEQAPKPIIAARPGPSAESPAPVTKGPERHDYLRIQLGTRLTYVGDPTFDRFATSDVLTQLSLDGTYGFLDTGRLSLAAGLAWEVGGRSDGLRRLPSTLTVHRLTVPFEGRYHVFPGVYAFGRVAPGTAALLASLTDPSSRGELEDSAWVFAADASVGASVLLGPRQELDRRKVRVWVTPELGYAWTTAATLAPRPDRNPDDVLGSDAGTRLGSLATRGVFWRLALAATF